MARRSIKRRRMVIGIGTLALAASGFVASGAYRVGSEGSLGDNWIQVSGASQAVSFNSPQPIDVGDSTGSEGTESSEGVGDGGGAGGGDDTGAGGGDDTGAGGGSDDDSDESLTSQLEVIVDPTGDNIVDPSGVPLTDGALIPWAGSIHKTPLTRGTENGLLKGIKSDKINNNAVTQYGTFSSTVPGDDVVFIIANGGSGESDISLPPVDILMRLYSSDSPEPIESDQIRFPYRIVDSDRSITSTGNDLSDPSTGSVELATGEVIEVIVEFDTTEGASDFDIFSELRFFATGEDS
jgi:hypothetical protein